MKKILKKKIDGFKLWVHPTWENDFILWLKEKLKEIKEGKEFYQRKTFLIFFPGKKKELHFKHYNFFLRYNYKGWVTLFKDFFRPTKALKSCRMGWFLLKKGIPTPFPVGVIEKRVFGFHFQSFLLTETLLPCRSLREEVENWEHSPHPEKRKIIKRIAALIAHLHNEGIYHGDLKSVNFLLKGDKPEVYLIDLGSIKSLHGISKRRMIKNLDFLNRSFKNKSLVTPRDRLFFLWCYLKNLKKNSPLKKYSFKFLARKIEKISVKKLKEKGRKFYP